MLKNKHILLGVTGSIAAYKAASLASLLVKQGADVHVIMTQNACRFISPVTFETLTGNKCLTDTFDRNFEFQVEHISLAKLADLCIIAPASANCIGKLAAGIADDMLTTTVLACRCPMLLSPAMNSRMFENPIVQENLGRLAEAGYQVITPATGRLACGDTGTGKMPEPQELMWWILREIACKKDMKGKRVLVTAGPTQESLDPVRFLTNHSSGRMGYAVAKMAMLRGAIVTLVSGPCALAPVPFTEMVPVVSARDMFMAVTERAQESDIVIKAAAVADFRPAQVYEDKLHKEDRRDAILLEPTDDILAYLGAHKRKGQLLCGFSMETKDVTERAKGKLRKKNLDMIAANSIRMEGAGFGTDTNILTLITRDGEVSLPLMSKEDAAMRLLDELMILAQA